MTMQTPPPPPPSQPHGHHGQHGHHSTHAHGRDKLPWSEEVWKRLDAAVHEEMARARIAARFLPSVHVGGKTLTIPSDTVAFPTVRQTSGTGAPEAGALSVDEGATTRINEFWVEFTMTPAQVEHESAEEAAMAHTHRASTGITLATRAANILSQAEDTIIFQGKNAVGTPNVIGSGSPLFTGTSPPTTTPTVNFRGTPTDLGLLNIVLTGTPQSQPALNPNQIIQVHPVTTSPPIGLSYQSNTVTAVAQAYSVLQAAGHYGPYALVLQTFPYADTHSPLPNTLILPADPIKELVTAGFYGSGTLPPWVTPQTQGTSPASNGLPPLPPNSSPAT